MCLIEKKTKFLTNWAVKLFFVGIMDNPNIDWFLENLKPGCFHSNTIFQVPGYRLTISAATIRPEEYTSTPEKRVEKRYTQHVDVWQSGRSGASHHVDVDVDTDMILLM